LAGYTVTISKYGMRITGLIGIARAAHYGTVGTKACIAMMT
jgi:hypothetical protein